jgi:hypothetical protein
MNSCENCGVEFTPRHPNRPGRFCSLTCYHASGRPTRKLVTAGQRMRRAPGHPIAPPSGTVAVCRLVLYEKIGPGMHPCHWCQKPISWMPGAGLDGDAIIADHLDWNIHNNDPRNLVPSCNMCNAHRTRSGNGRLIKPDELFTIDSYGRHHRAAERFCVICGTRFLAALEQVRIGRGLYCSRSCARRAPKRHRTPSS